MSTDSTAFLFLAWLKAINARLDDLRGPFNTYLDEQLISIVFCDGHGINTATIAGLRDMTKYLTSELNGVSRGEDGQGQSVMTDIVSLYGWVHNSTRLGELA